MTLSTVAGVL